MKKGQRARLTLWNFFCNRARRNREAVAEACARRLGRVDKCIHLKEKHMHDPKVNTKIGDVASPDVKKTLLTLNCVGHTESEEGHA